MLFWSLPKMLNETQVATMADSEELLTQEQHLEAPIFLGEAKWGNTHRAVIVFLKPIVLSTHSHEFPSPGRARNRKAGRIFSFWAEFGDKANRSRLCDFENPIHYLGLKQWQENKRRDGRHKVPFHSTEIKTHLHPLAEILWTINRPLGPSHMIQYVALNSLCLNHSWFETLLMVLLQCLLSLLKA